MRLFIQSSLFNDGRRPQKSQALLEHLSEYHPHFEDEGLKKETLFLEIFPEETYSESKLDKVATELVKVIRKFIAVFCSDALADYQYWLSQAQFFRLRRLNTEFQYAIDRIEKLQQKMPFRGEDYFYRQFNLEHERMIDLVDSNDRKKDINATSTIKNLDIFYIITKMVHCSYLLIQGNHKQQDNSRNHAFALIDKVLETAKDNYLDIPVVAAYYYSYALLLHRWEENEDNYYQLKAVLQNYGEEFSHSSLIVFHNCLRNYIVGRYNKGDNTVLPELLDLIKNHAAQATIYQEGGDIPASTLQSAITVALKLGDYKWAIDFLTQHRYRIVGADDPEAIYQFNLANCLFHKGDFIEAERLLANYNFREMFYKLAARRLEIKLYYEARSPLLDARLDAFKILVHEMKSILTVDKIAPNNHFIDLLRQILAPKTLRNRERIQKLLDKLENQKAVAEREWLKKKLEEMMKRC